MLPIKRHFLLRKGRSLQMDNPLSFYQDHKKPRVAALPLMGSELKLPAPRCEESSGKAKVYLCSSFPNPAKDGTLLPGQQATGNALAVPVHPQTKAHPAPLSWPLPWAEQSFGPTAYFSLKTRWLRSRGVFSL
jgi:hypothetical protein